jgi:hypothetical protein
MRRAMALFLATLFCAPAPRAMAAGGALPVDVYMNPDNVLFSFTYGAKALAKAIFARIGVELIWHNGLPRTTQTGMWTGTRPAIGIAWDKPPEWAGPQVLAAAFPYSSSVTTITLYEDRLVQYLREHKDMEEIVLAYVLAHELAHVMQGIDRHSASGILKAEWSHQDWELMRNGRLTFTPEDVELIREGLKRKPAAKTGTLAG